ncbi:MAG: alpha/beta fold hydrolase [Alphaproteobacteria bacterium]|nr:alpha/beta fold hydrolase [Alphaproteobacteria bacterium]MBV9420577.1 alpha/beta fold hydrolase [Alphaproteobacteria bacterium]
MTRLPLVMIHGAFVGPWSFDYFREPFEDAGYRVHTPILRHHDKGLRPPSSLGATSLLDYAADLEAFIKTLDDTPVLVGHSLGGLLAQMLAARGHARALVLLAPCPPWGVLPSTLFEIASAQAMLLTGPLWNQVLKPDYDVAAAHSLDRLSPVERKRVFARFVPESGLATSEIMHWGWDAKRASHVSASAVTCPILCITGEHDKINPPSTMRRVAARYRDCTFEEASGHSHWLLGEVGWEKIAQRSLDWINKTVGAPARKRAKSRR